MYMCSVLTVKFDYFFRLGIIFFMVQGNFTLYDACLIVNFVVIYSVKNTGLFSTQQIST